MIVTRSGKEDTFRLIIDFKKAPPVSKELLMFLSGAVDADVLLTEAKHQEITGVEQLGFIKGARYALGILQSVKRHHEDQAGM
jgi:hypothetical protein